MGEEIALHYFTIENLCDLVLELGRGAVVYKWDLKKAYRQIPADPADYCFLGYRWYNGLYFDLALATRQRNAAMTRAIMFLHQKSGHRGGSYLDDLIGVSATGTGMCAYEEMGSLL